MQEDDFRPCTNQQTGHRFVVSLQPTYPDPSELDYGADQPQQPGSPYLKHHIRRRNETGLFQEPPANQQLPPQSPAPPSSTESMNGRLTRRQTANHVSLSSPPQQQTSQRVFRSLLAAGDRQTLGRHSSSSNETERQTDYSEPHGSSVPCSNQHRPTTPSDF
ncbi:hypothetical protein P879_02156 [Paragonimus westermani]|uniref:Uncharacterized protein n=1 Tax=Paragonimus westermani TaxID=34504 RepID=A0A8T0DK17_9TREM|nr:hypothetical protein P879_02156 [Paragonimus westermani]